MKKQLLVYAFALCCGLCSCGQNPTNLRIMSYNVHNCIGLDNVRDYNRIANIIKQAAPDVVAFLPQPFLSREAATASDCCPRSSR